MNGGVDETSGMQVGPKTEPIADEVLDYDTVMARMDSFMDWLATQYVTALNLIRFTSRSCSAMSAASYEYLSCM